MPAPIFLSDLDFETKNGLFSLSSVLPQVIYV